MRGEREDAFVTWGRVMKSSNLAVRMALAEEFEADAVRRAEAVAMERRAAQRRARLRKSFDYRAIVIREQAPRLFRVR